MDSVDAGADVLKRGQRIGKYEILTRLSTGGMAELFLCFTTGPGGFRKFLTVKRILPDYRDDDEFVVMFLDEARITASLSHSNIAQVFDLGQEGGELFIAMEFIPGQDMSRVTKAFRKQQRAIPVGFACRVIHDLCLALHYAHTFRDHDGKPAPIIHRDVSPKNVMVTYAGNVKAIDFGIAKARDRLSGTQAGQLKGSVRYMSPEQVSGDPLTGQSDLFSAGVILHELLTGRTLFVGDSHRETAQKVLSAPIPSPLASDPSIPAAVADVAMKALERDKTARFETGLQMARALEAAVGPTMYDEAQLSEVMRELFEDAIERTYALMDSPTVDTGRLRAVAGELAELTPGSSSKVQGPTQTAPTRPMEGPSRASPAAPAGAARILCVDDSATVRGFLEQSLLRAGYDAVGLASPVQALETLRKKKFDLLILDVMMPEMDGFTLCRHVRELPALLYVPILFLSAACSVEERVKGLSVGADDFIRKPCDPAELVARVRIHLQRIRLLQQMSQAPSAGGAHS